jgi:hypothetical protein
MIDKIISGELAQKLIQIVKEYGQNTEYSGNSNTKEYRIEPLGIDKGLISAGLRAKNTLLDDVVVPLHALCRELESLIPILIKNTACELISGVKGYWLMEYSEGGEFEEHVDWSLDQDDASTPAVFTLSVQLNDNYTGGELIIDKEPLEKVKLRGYIWDGWTYHTAKPVLKGKRYCLVVHFLGKLKD